MVLGSNGMFKCVQSSILQCLKCSKFGFLIFVPLLVAIKGVWYTTILFQSSNYLEIKEKYLVPPPNKKFSYNFLRKKIVKLNGQANQPILIDEKVFKSRIKNGFFIEAGAYDGEYFSNTLFFELKQRWTGLLIEPNPDAFKRLKKKVRL